MNKTYVFDLDGTLCTLVDGNYSQAKPIIERIKTVNDLFSNGYVINIYTARGMGRFSNDGSLASEEFRSLTEKQLLDWGVKYHNLFMGKPAADVYVDDKSQSDTQFFGDANHL
jgi:hypothetical protein